MYSSGCSLRDAVGSDSKAFAYLSGKKKIGYFALQVQQWLLTPGGSRQRLQSICIPVKQQHRWFALSGWALLGQAVAALCAHNKGSFRFQLGLLLGKQLQRNEVYAGAGAIAMGRGL
jgi:hypothetical protein